MTEVRRTASPADWEACKRIRFEVFVGEQAVPAELELDDHDASARHWLAFDGGEAVGTARVVEREDGWKVGRVAVRAPWRGRGMGLALMEAIAAEARTLGVAQLMLESQVQAIPFYERLGYVAEGDVYLDCNIPHRLMRQALTSARSR